MKVMKVFIYDKKESKPYLVLQSVLSVEEKEKTICFHMPNGSVLEISKKVYKSTAYQN